MQIQLFKKVYIMFAYLRNQWSNVVRDILITLLVAVTPMLMRSIGIVAFLAFSILLLNVPRYIIPLAQAITVMPNMAIGVAPKVNFLSQTQVISYLEKNGTLAGFNNLGQGKIGDVKNIEAAISGNYTYAALLAKNNRTNHVFIQISTHGMNNFGEPAELTSPANYNASHLGMVAFGNSVFVIWQDTAKNGTNSIYLATSMDRGMNFNVYKQNVGKGDATDPKIISDGIREFDTWIQQCSSNTGGGNSTSGSNNATGLAGNKCPPGEPTHHDGQGHSRHW